MYSKILKWFCRKKLKKIAGEYPHTLKELIRYHDLMAIECVNQETPAQAHILGISLSTVKWLETHNKQMWQKGKL